MKKLAFLLASKLIKELDFQNGEPYSIIENNLPISTNFFNLLLDSCNNYNMKNFTPFF